MKYSIGCIGCGNMGGALVRALAKTLPGNEIAVCDKHPEKTEALKKECGVVVTTADDIARHAKFVMLGVKPQVLVASLNEIKELLLSRSDVILVSMAASVSIDEILHEMMGEFVIGSCSVQVIRMMPNTPVSLGEGVIEYACRNVDDIDKKEFCRIFDKAGLLDEISEEKIDAASALSGCGPAFVYLFAEALSDGAVACGLPRDKAIRYAAKTLIGAGRMIEEYGHLSDLKDAVCSPGGTTIQGVRALENGAVRSAAMNAVIAAYEKTLSLQNK